MAITDIWWDGGGYDIHIIPANSSDRLDQKLRFEQETGGTTTTHNGDSPPTGVTVTFAAEYKGAPAAGHGISSFNTATGVVTVDPVLPISGLRLYNFIIRATVSEVGGSCSDADKASGRCMETIIRVHIHDSVNKIWLTPNTLTVYDGTTNQQFTVLAEFNEGQSADNITVGDITNSNWLFYTPTQNPGAISISSSTGKITINNINQLAKVKVSIGAIVPGPNFEDEKEVKTKASLAQARSIIRIRGHGPVNFSNKTNVLFVPDGFLDTEKGYFNKIINRIVRKLQKDGHIFPYNKLEDSINYWRIQDSDFVPSQEQNVSVLAELDIRGRRSGRRGKPVPFPIKPDSTATHWTIENLVYKVGLPVSPDRSKSKTTKINEWQTLYDGISGAKIRLAVFNRWRRLADRTIANERDTAFGIRINDHPRIDRDEDRVTTLHERRTTSGQFQDFLVNIKHGGNTVGTTWTTGKDKDLICFISRSELVGGSQNETGFSTTLGRSEEVRLLLVSPPDRGIELFPMNLLHGGSLRPLHPAIPPNIAHECAHSFGLKDEYGGGTGANLPTHLVATYSSSGNIQPESDIALPIPQIGFDVTKIRWAWPRVKAAGVLTGQPTPSGSNFTVTLTTVRAGDFSSGDTVRLRKKDFIGAPLKFNADYTFNKSQDPASAFSDRFIIDTVIGNQITIKPDAGSSLTAANFPAGSLLIATVPASPTPPATVGDDLPLLAPIILSHIDTSNGPLNAPSGNPTRPCRRKRNPISVMTARNIPSGLPKNRPRNKANIVGIYEGGVYHDCGVFHAAGLCMMRSIRYQSRSKLKTAPFCQICRYLIVDRVNAIKHKEVDKNYKYPEP